MLIAAASAMLLIRSAAMRSGITGSTSPMPTASSATVKLIKRMGAIDVVSDFDGIMHLRKRLIKGQLEG